MHILGVFTFITPIRRILHNSITKKNYFLFLCLWCSFHQFMLAIKPYIYLILVLAVVYMIKRLNRNLYLMAWFSFLFISSRIVGWIMLNTPISTNVSLLTIFSGLFGVSTLIYSITQNSVVPAQDRFHNFRINKNIIRGIFAGGIAGSILGFLQGMGPAQGSILAQELSGGGDRWK